MNLKKLLSFAALINTTLGIAVPRIVGKIANEKIKNPSHLASSHRF